MHRQSRADAVRLASRARGRGRDALGCLVLGCVLLLGCPRFEVVRVIDGQPIVGDFVSPRAYSAYARGAFAEAAHDDRAALTAYLAAVASDDQSPELWTRIAATRCRLGQEQAADVAFARGAELDERYEPLWRARAECQQARGALPAAVAALRVAAQLGPDRVETQLLYAQLLERAGRSEEAQAWAQSIVARWPRCERAWRELEALARAHGAQPWAEAAHARLQSFSWRGSSPFDGADAPAADAGSAWQGVDDALAHDDLDRARQEIRRARLDDRQLAARALALGKSRLALDQAGLLVAADPSDTESRLAAALAADLCADRGRLQELARVPQDAQPVSAVGRLLAHELIARHVGQEAAKLWLDATEALEGALTTESGATRELVAKLARRGRALGTEPTPR